MSLNVNALPQVAQWWAIGGDSEKAAQFRKCAQCIETVTVRLLIARQQSAAWATILRCLGKASTQVNPENTGTVRSIYAGASLSAGCLRAKELGMCLTRDVVQLVGKELRMRRLASTEVVRRTRMQPPRHEFSKDLLPMQGSGDRSRAIRAWKRSRRQQAASQQTAMRATHVVATPRWPVDPGRLAAAEATTTNGRHDGETKRRR
eukprot:COSAG02_NODE_8933_length_2394_cov_7.778214_4_plen_205_part_00